MWRRSRDRHAGDQHFAGRRESSVGHPCLSLPHTRAPLQRFSNKEMKALKGTKFPKEFAEKVDVRKVNMASEYWQCTSLETPLMQSKPRASHAPVGRQDRD